MKVAKCHLTSKSPYSQGRAHFEPKLDKEGADAYEHRTWMKRLHVTTEGQVFIPPMAFANCAKESAKYLSIQIPGKGKSTYTKHFDAGLMVVEPLVLEVQADDVPGEWLYVPADGRPGGSKRVQKCFPRIDEWEGDVDFWLLDDTITEDVFRHVMKEAGRLIGIGRFRPRNRGYYGRFDVELREWVSHE